MHTSPCLVSQFIVALGRTLLLSCVWVPLSCSVSPIFTCFNVCKKVLHCLTSGVKPLYTAFFQLRWTDLSFKHLFFFLVENITIFSHTIFIYLKFYLKILTHSFCMHDCFTNMIVHVLCPCLVSVEIKKVLKLQVLYSKCMYS